MKFYLTAVPVKSSDKMFVGFVMTGYLLIFAFVLRKYIAWQSINVILGIVIIPLVTRVSTTNNNSLKQGVIAAVVVALSFLLPVKTMLFVSVLFAIVFLANCFYGYVNLLPIITGLLLTPFFQYFINVFSFSIRLSLSSWAGAILRCFGDKVTVAGNMIEANGKEFSVDPACMGLNMMVTGILIGIALIGLNEKKAGKAVSGVQVLMLLAAVSLFNLISNLIRILLLVKFAVMPESVMHELIGVLTFILYVCLPAALLVKRFVKVFGKSDPQLPATESPISRHYILHLLLLNAVSSLAVKISGREMNKSVVSVVKPVVPGFKSENLGDNILKLANKDALIYIKPVDAFYTSDHNPMICWKGSGYQMKTINDAIVCGKKVHTATLEKSGSKLFTAWWFDNGANSTTSQLEWRWDMIKGGSNYSVVNITASTSQALSQQVKMFFEKRPLQAFSRQAVSSTPHKVDKWLTEDIHFSCFPDSFPHI